MTLLKEGDWVRYTEAFCRDTSTTSMGMLDQVRRRGRVILVYDDGRLCNIDWGDHVLQSQTDSPIHEITDPPSESRSDDPIRDMEDAASPAL